MEGFLSLSQNNMIPNNSPPSLKDICKHLGLEDPLFEKIEQRVKWYKQLPEFEKVFDSLEKYKSYRDEKWAYYKFMFIVDILSLSDSFCQGSSQKIISYVDKIYQPYHLINLDRDKPDYVSIADEMIEKFVDEPYKNTQFSYLMKVMISLHLDIREQSLINEEFREKEYYTEYMVKKYDVIDKQMRELHKYIVIQLIRKNKYNDKILNLEFRFCKFYQQSSQEFKNHFKHVLLLLEYQQLINQKKQSSPQSSFASNVANPLSQSQSLRLRQIVVELKEFDSHHILDLLIIDHNPQAIYQEIQEPIGQISDIDRLQMAIKRGQLIPDSISLQEIDMMKFKAMEHFLRSYRFQEQKNLDVFFELLKGISFFFKRTNSSLLYDELISIMKPVLEIKTNLNNNFTIYSLLGDNYQKIQEILNIINLKIAGRICTKWKQHLQINNALHTILLIGKTKVGKSSYINFLDQSNIAQVGQRGYSQTFFPRKYRIDALEDSELFDLPGLEDNRSLIHQLCICYFLHHLIQKSSSIKLLYFIKTDVLQVDNFKELSKIICKFLSCKIQHLDSLQIIYSHVKTLQQGKAEVLTGRNKIQEKILQNEIVTQLSMFSQENPRNFIQHLRNKLTTEGMYQFFSQTNHNPNANPIALSLIPQQMREMVLNGSRQQIAQNNIIQRQNHITLINNLNRISDIKFVPITLLQSCYINQINRVKTRTSDKLNQFMSNYNTNYRSFLEQFEIFKIFIKINPTKAQQSYLKLKTQLEEDFKIIYSNYSKLNLVQKEQDKVLTIETMMIDYVLKQYMEKQMKIVEQSFKSFFMDPSISNQKDQRISEINWIVYKYRGQYNQKFMKENINLIALEDSPRRQIYYRIQEQFRIMKENFCGQRNLANDIVKYLTNLIKMVQKDLKAIQRQKLQKENKEIKKNILFRYKNFVKTFFKDFLAEDDNKIQGLQTTKRVLSLSNKTFLGILVAFKNRKVDDELHRMLHYFLQIQSRENYENKLIINSKADKVLGQSNLFGIDKTWRFNYYGECYCNIKVKLSQILLVNSRKDLSTQTYKFLEYKDIRIYCDQIDLDEEILNIECKESFKIIARKINLLHEKYKITVKTMNDVSANLVILWRESNNVNIYKILKNSTHQFYSSFSNLMPNISHLNLISRTKISDGEYYQAVDQTKPFFCLGKHDQSARKFIRIIKKTTTQKLIQFGMLHLHKTILLMKNPELQLSIAHFNDTDMCRKIVFYIIQDFSHNTSIQLCHQLFSTAFCHKIALIMKNPRETYVDMFSSQKYKSQETRNFLKECSNIMKKNLQSHIYKYIVDDECQENGLGRNSQQIFMKKKDKLIKPYCKDLLSLNLIQFQKKYAKEQKLLKLTKKFIMEFQKNILFGSHTQFNILGIIKSFLKTVYKKLMKKQNQTLKIKSQCFTQNLVHSELRRLDQFSRVQLQQADFVEENDPQNSFKSSSVNDFFGDKPLLYLSLDKLRAELNEHVKSYKFSTIINQYQQRKGDFYVFADKLDEIHSQIGYIYLKTLQFNKIQNEIELIPTGMAKDKNVFLYEIVKTKYKNVQQIIKDIENKSKQEQYPQLVTCLKQFQNPYSKTEGSHSANRKSGGDQKTHNILFLDSAKNNNNYIVNMVFAAEIQKHTHRPIMHMFDKIVCKNSSSLLGSCLSIPDKKSSLKRIYPKYSACQVLQQSTKNINASKKKPIENINSVMKSLINKNDLSQMKISSLPISLTLISENNSIDPNQKNKDVELKSLNNCYRYQDSNIVSMCDYIYNSIQCAGKEYFCNPIIDVFSDRHVNLLQMKANIKVNILSLGSSARNTYHEYNLQDLSEYNMKLGLFERWQPFLNFEETEQKTSVVDYIDHARIFLQERWMTQTKRMRQLFDSLEDRDNPQ